MIASLPSTLSPQPEEGFTVTSTLLPEFVAEGDSFESVPENANHVLITAVELYEERGRELPPGLYLEVGDMGQ